METIKELIIWLANWISPETWAAIGAFFANAGKAIFATYALTFIAKVVMRRMGPKLHVWDVEIVAIAGGAVSSFALLWRTQSIETIFFFMVSAGFASIYLHRLLELLALKFVPFLVPLLKGRLYKKRKGTAGPPNNMERRRNP